MWKGFCLNANSNKPTEKTQNLSKNLYMKKNLQLISLYTMLLSPISGNL